MTTQELISSLLKENELSEDPEEIYDVFTSAFDKGLNFEVIRSLFKIYSRYILIINVKNVGTDPKYIKAGNNAMTLYSFILSKQYNKHWDFESSPFVDALGIGNGNFDKYVAKEKEISDMLKKQAVIKKEERRVKYDSQY